MLYFSRRFEALFIKSSEMERHSSSICRTNPYKCVFNVLSVELTYHGKKKRWDADKKTLSGDRGRFGFAHLAKEPVNESNSGIGVTAPA